VRRLALIAWFAFVIIVGGVLGTRSAKADYGCDTTCFCNCSENSRGKFQYYFKVQPCSWCGGGYDQACETDHCGGSCGEGYISYCQWGEWVGKYPRCFGQDCT
jgi:hypothetical protein